MNPYQKTAEEMKRQSEGPKRFAKNATAIASAGGALAFAPVLARVAPFLSEYIPEDLAIKGLSKINPKFGEFIQKGLNSGFDFKEVKDFLGEQINQSQQEPAKENRNIIEQESPELHQFIDQEIKKGRNPIEAGALAQNDKRFRKVIGKLSQDHKTPWSSILESVYGAGERALPQQQQQPQQQQAQPAQGGQGQQALMAILQKINQKIGQ